MKRLALLAIVSALTFTGLSANAGGGIAMPIWYDNPISTYIQSMEDGDIKDALLNNLLTISNNSVVEDWEYNNTHFYTKQLTTSIVIPEDLKSKVTRAYIGFSASEPMMYDTMSAIPATPVQGENHLQIDLSLDALSGTVKVNRTDLDAYINNDYGTSFMGTVYVEFGDDITVPLSNTFWLYVQKDNVEGKKAHLTNLYYTQNQYMGYANIYELLQKVFEKIEKKLGSTVKYIAALEGVIKKIDEKLVKIEATQKAMAEGITSEDDFAGKVKDFGTHMQKYNLLNDIKYNVANEIQTKQSEGVIDELFGEEMK